jgi:protein SCO1/2
VKGAWRYLAVLGALALFAAAILVARAESSGARRTHAVLRGTDVFGPGSRPAPAFSLRDQNGRTISLRSLRGHVVAITFLDSRCRKECPVAGRELAAAQRELGPHSPLIVVVVSVDPSADTPDSARAFMRESGIHGSWHWLFGDRAHLLPVWGVYGIQVQPARGDILHTAAVYLVDRKGSVRVADAVPFFPSQLAESARALL